MQTITRPSTSFRSLGSILFLALFSLFSSSSFAANNFTKKITTIQDSSILSLSQHDFNDKLNHYIDLMREEADFTEEEYIEMVLIDNTYTMFLQHSNPNYRIQKHKEYLDLLKPYMDDIIETLEANEMGCNGGYYSNKYQLCVGGTEPNEKSFYQVD